MRYILTAFAATFFAIPILFAGSGNRPVGGGLIDDVIPQFDDTSVDLPGESSRKPSVSRSARLVDDSTRDTWGSRDDDSSSSKSSSSKSSSSKSSSSSSSSGGSRSNSSGNSSSKSSSSSSSSGGSRSNSSGSSRSSSSGSGSGSSRSSSSAVSSDNPYSSYFSESKSFNSDGSYIPYSERYPEPEKEKSDSDFDRNTFDPNFNPFKNNYKYGDTNYNPNGTRPEYEETRRKIKDIIGSVPKVMTNEKVDEMIHNPARAATLEAPTTPNRWTHAPNSWFCDYDDVMAKAQQTGKAVAVFFHNSSNDNSRKFKTERMESSKFKSKMRDRLLVLYMDFPQNAGTSKDKRNREQVEHNRRIADKFRVSNYPTVIFLNSSGNEIGRITNMRTLTEFVEEADRIVPQAKPRDNRNSTGFKVGGSISGQGGQNDGQNGGQNGDQGNQNGSQNGGQGGWPQGGDFGGGFPQGGWPQGGDFGGGFPQGGWPQGGFPGGGFPQGGWGN